MQLGAYFGPWDSSPSKPRFGSKSLLNFFRKASSQAKVSHHFMHKKINRSWYIYIIIYKTLIPLFRVWVFCNTSFKMGRRLPVTSRGPISLHFTRIGSGPTLSKVEDFGSGPSFSGLGMTSVGASRFSRHSHGNTWTPGVCGKTLDFVVVVFLEGFQRKGVFILEPLGKFIMWDE